MSWKIDRDYIAEAGDKSDVGRGQFNEHAPAELTYRFRLLDDDGEVYYGGRYDMPAMIDDDGEYGSLYMALKWSEGYAGCADLQVKAVDYVALVPTAADFAESHRQGEWLSIYA